MMYGSLAVDLDGYSAFYKPNILLDPESSESLLDEEASDSFEENDNDRDFSEESSGLDSTSWEDSGSVSESSGELMSSDHPGHDDTDNENIQSAAETETGQDVGSDTDTGTDSRDPEYEEENRIEDKEDDNDFDSFESDGDEYNRELEYSDYECAESDTVEYDDGSGDSESGTESGTSVREDSTVDIEFYQQNIELLGIIAGCLLFLVVTKILKYSYKFFNLFF